MFFKIKTVKGIPYLYRIEAFRSKITGKPTNSADYVGPLEKIEAALDRWRKKNG